jgi:cell division protein FtsL
MFRSLPKYFTYPSVIIFICIFLCNNLTLREELRLRVFENRVLRKILGPERDEVRGEWRRLHKEELCDSSSDQIKKLSWAEHVARMGDRITYRILVGRPERRTPVGRSGGR